MQYKTILTICLFMATTSSAVANTIYTVDLPSAGDVTVMGTITTDGTLGILTAANFLSWDLTVSSSSLGVSNELTPANTTLARFEGITATNVSLFILPPALIDVEGAGNQVIVTPVPPGTFAEQLRVSISQATDGPEIGLSMSGVQLATGGIAVTPLPAALPLFATGLGALCLLGRLRMRRKRTFGAPSIDGQGGDIGSS